MSLLEKLSKSTVLPVSGMISDSPAFHVVPISTGIPIIDMAFYGEVNGGLVPGVTILAGPSRSFKTLLALISMRAYLDKYPDGIAIVYDSEGSLTPEYLSSTGVDITRVIYGMVEDIEQLKFDLMEKLEEIKKGDHVFFLIDSLGGLSSKKEVEDAIDQNSVTDMTRAKAIRSMLRLATPRFASKQIPCVIINHIYVTMEKYSKAVVGGGTAVMYAANQVFIISRSTDRDEDKDVKGYTFKLSVEKSRFVTEGSKFPFEVTFEDGLNRYSGLFDLAMDLGWIRMETKGWYLFVDPTTGEWSEKKQRRSDIESNHEWFDALIASPKFDEAVKKNFKLGVAPMISARSADD